MKKGASLIFAGIQNKDKFVAMRVFFASFLIYFFILPNVNAQETLPGFSASLKPNGKVLISWRNGFPAVNQISIQRSTDSLKNFTTLITVPDPRIAENGFVDGKANGPRFYYRIFILFPNSKYMFTRSKKAGEDPGEQPVLAVKEIPAEKPKPEKPATQLSDARKTSKPASSTASIPTATIPANASIPAAVPNKPPVTTPTKPAEVTKTPPVSAPEEEKYLILPKIDNSRIFYMVETSNLKKPAVKSPVKLRAPTIEVEKTLFVKRRDTVIMKLSAKRLGWFSDSLVKQTKDTLYFVNADTLQIKPYVEVSREPKEVYKISAYVFAGKDGNITISLADYAKKKYFIAFYEADSSVVMEVKEVKDSRLIIDKTNFGHAGWFRFELYEDGKLKEKNRLLIPRD